MFHYGLLSYEHTRGSQECSSNSLKGLGVCYHVYVIGAHKRTYVGPSEHAQPLYFYLPQVNVCMCGSTEGDCY